jgi:hypothetical protein
MVRCVAAAWKRSAAVIGGGQSGANPLDNDAI